MVRAIIMSRLYRFKCYRNYQKNTLDQQANFVFHWIVTPHFIVGHMVCTLGQFKDPIYLFFFTDLLHNAADISVA
jgi:hypothetical protein